MNTHSKRPVCGMCTFKLTMIAYQRAPWFRLIREPLLLGIRLFAFFHNVEREVEAFSFPTSACHKCIRFYKSVLFKKSFTFRLLHSRINPIFNYFLDRIVTEEERQQAHSYAGAACAGTLSDKEIYEWMKGMKPGL